MSGRRKGRRGNSERMFFVCGLLHFSTPDTHLINITQWQMLPHSAASAWKPQLWLSQHGWQCPHQVLEVNPGVGWLDKARTRRGLWKREKCQCTSKTHVQPAWLQCSAINPRIFLFLRWRRFAAAFNTVTRLTSFSFFFLCDLLIQTLRLIPRPETTSGFF